MVGEVKNLTMNIVGPKIHLGGYNEFVDLSIMQYYTLAC